MGWNANQTLGFLLLRRMKRAGFRPMGFSMNDYGLAIWSFKKPENVNDLLDTDIVFEEFEEWLQDTPLLKRLFRDVALISGLVEKRIPGVEKTGKQVLFSTDLIYEVLIKYDSQHVLLEAVKEDAMDGLIDGSRLRETLHQLRENILVKYLDQISPLSLPIILDVTKESIGYSIGKDDILAEMQEENFLKMKHFKIKFASETFEILPSGTIFWPSEEMLIASDLHLEKGSSFNKEGTFLPPYDSFDTITRLEEIIKITSPKKILLLGDTLHDKNGLLRMSEEVKKKIFSLLKKNSFILISGNHDEELEFPNLKLDPYYKLRNITFTHEMSSNETLEISGHFHPMVNTKFKGIRIRASCFVVTKNKIILPSFGTFTGGLDIKNNAFPNIINKETKVFIIYNQQIINLKDSYF